MSSNIELDAERYELCSFLSCYVVSTAQLIFCRNCLKKHLVQALLKIFLQFTSSKTERNLPSCLDLIVAGLQVQFSGESENLCSLDTDNFEV